MHDPVHQVDRKAGPTAPAHRGALVSGGIRIFSGWAFPEETLLPIAQRCTGLNQAFVIGWSLGGIRALAESLEGRGVRPLVLISSTARFWGDDQGWPGVPRAQFRALQKQFARSPQEALTGFHRLCAGASLAEAVLAERIQRSMMMDREMLAGELRALDQLDLRPRLGQLQAPLLLLHGACDAVIPASASERVAEQAPRAVRRVHATAGHNLPITHPDWVAEQILDFLHHLP